MARTYKRDARGRFAGGGGGSSSGGPAKVGRSGPRGGKVGTRTEQSRNAKAQAARSAAFSSKATGAGREAKARWKSAMATAVKAASRAPENANLGAIPEVRRVKRMVDTRSTTGPKRGRPAGASGGKVGNSYQQKKAAAAQTARNKQFSSKAAPNKAKEAYRDARSTMREARMYAGGRTSTAGIAKNRADAGAKRIRANVAAVKAAQKKVAKMEATRGAYKPRRRRS